MLVWGESTGPKIIVWGGGGNLLFSEHIFITSLVQPTVNGVIERCSIGMFGLDTSLAIQRGEYICNTRLFAALRQPRLPHA